MPNAPYVSGPAWTMKGRTVATVEVRTSVPGDVCGQGNIRMSGVVERKCRLSRDLGMAPVLLCVMMMEVRTHMPGAGQVQGMVGGLLLSGAV